MSSSKRRPTKKQQEQRASKSWSERQHAKSRAKLRCHGFQYNRIKRRQILDLIFVQKRAVLVAEQSNNRHVYDLMFEGNLLRVVIDRKRSEVITFLNPSWQVKDRDQIQQILKGEAVHPFFAPVISFHEAQVYCVPPGFRIRQACLICRQTRIRT